MKSKRTLARQTFSALITTPHHLLAAVKRERRDAIGVTGKPGAQVGQLLAVHGSHRIHMGKMTLNFILEI